MGERCFAREGSFAEHKNEYGVKNLFRYADKFSMKEKEVIELFQYIPFLNGGLFDCLDKPNDEGKIVYVDGFSRNPKKQAKVPDFLFFSDETEVDLNEIYGTRNKKYKVKGLINLLDSYKFTVAENTPIEEEIALDPELLGKVFENLLASYNPETQTTARKQTGSFYTPREIVNYMVDESLLAYLKQSLSSCHYVSSCHSERSEESYDLNNKEMLHSTQHDKNEERLRDLLSYSENPNPFNEKETLILIEAIDNCKILDPACGSGAFPMGILHKLVHILHKIDPRNELWKQRQIDKALQIDDPNIRDHTIQDIEEAFENNELDYGRKLYLIENCIYGVDIQPIAVQIAKLRFFISLIIDEKKQPGKENLGIRSLPNLETKFVAANTLVALDKPQGQLSFRNPKIERLEKELKELRHEYFNAKTRKEKLQCQKQDKKLRQDIAGLLVNDGWNNTTARQIAAFDLYDQNATADFFDSEWMFGVKDGFDMVIANPPYVQLQKDSGRLANLYKNCSNQTFERIGDIYSLFYEKGITLLKNGAVLTFITSNKWMRAGYGKSLRKYFNAYNPRLLIDLGPGIFESATVDTNILIIEKKKNQGQLAGLTLNAEARDKDLSDYISNNKNILPKMGDDAWFIGSDAEQKLKEKIERIGKPLKEWDVNIYFGIKTGLNDAFIVDMETSKRLVAEDPKSAEILKPILRGRDVKRYGYEWAGLWLIASGFDIDVPKKYPAVFRHLKQFEEKAKKRDDQGQNWWNLRACAYYQEFEREKVVWARLMRVHKTDDISFPRFSVAHSGTFVSDSLCIITGSDLHYLTGVLNSTYGENYFRKNIAILDNGGMQMRQQYVENILIPPITPSNKGIVGKIDCIVEKILSAKKQNPAADTSPQEREIDQLVYKLYDLTPEEIAIVEGKE